MVQLCLSSNFNDFKHEHFISSPTDPVFPGLTKEEGTGALIGRFEAFKFTDTTVVNFQVNVQFCQECNPVIEIPIRKS